MFNNIIITNIALFNVVHVIEILQLLISCCAYKGLLTNNKLTHKNFKHSTSTIYSTKPIYNLHSTNTINKIQDTDKIPLISNKGVHCTVIKCQGNIFNRRGLKYSNKLTFKVTDKGTVTLEENLMYTVYSLYLLVVSSKCFIKWPTRWRG